MQRFTATQKNEAFLITNQFSEEIGQLIIVNNTNVVFHNAGEEFEFIIDKNNIDILKNENKIESFKKYNVFGNYISTNSEVKIKGISSWEGGTLITDCKGQTLVTLQHNNVLTDHGIYNFSAYTEVESYQLALMLYLHMKGSKIKTTIAIVASVALAPIIIKLFN